MYTVRIVDCNLRCQALSWSLTLESGGVSDVLVRSSHSQLRRGLCDTLRLLLSPRNSTSPPVRSRPAELFMFSPDYYRTVPVACFVFCAPLLVQRIDWRRGAEMAVRKVLTHPPSIERAPMRGTSRQLAVFPRPLPSLAKAR